VARLIYAFLALSLGTLVAGFLVRDSSIPLLVSIGLSALVLLLILVGTSRRLRRANALEDERTELSELEIVEIDEDATAATVLTETRAARRAPRRRRTVAVEPDTQAMDALDEFSLADEPDVTEVVETPARTRRKASVKPRPSRRRARPAEIEPGPEDAVDVELEDEDTETVAESRPPLTIEMPPPRKASRPRRRAAAPAPAERAATTGRAAAQPAGLSPPGLSPKVWVIPGRSRYHTQDCRFAKGDDLREVTEATAQRRGYVACNVCKPGSGG
jgi:hypothetical protein